MDGRRRDARTAGREARRHAASVGIRLLLASIGVLLPSAARADFLPSRPIAFWNDRLVISGEATVTIGQPDRGYFNAIDYYHDALNLARFGLSFEFRPNDRIAVLGQVIDQIALRSDSSADAWSDQTSPPLWEPFDTNRHIVRPYALFVRVRPFLDKPIAVQAGRIPPVFGAYANQDYGVSQPLISLPLAYHYPTTLRADSVVRSSAGLARWRGGGWRVRYRTGADNWGQGVPLISSQRWDTGVQVKVGDAATPIVVSGAVTNGTLSSPQFEDDNDGKQVSGRVAFRPVTGLVLGVSGAHGDFLSDRVIAVLPAELADRSYTQQAFGADVEYSRGYWLVKSETIVTSWRMPALDAPLLDDRLRAWSTFVEGRYRLTPRFYVAARGEYLGFSKIQAGAEYNYERVTWDGPVTRLEIGGGYSIQRNVRVKIAYQYDWRDAGSTRRRGALATQIGYWF